MSPLVPLDLVCILSLTHKNRMITQQMISSPPHHIPWYPPTHHICHIIMTLSLPQTINMSSDSNLLVGSRYQWFTLHTSTDTRCSYYQKYTKIKGYTLKILVSFSRFMTGIKEPLCSGVIINVVLMLWYLNMCPVHYHHHTSFPLSLPHQVTIHLPESHHSHHHINNSHTNTTHMYTDFGPSHTAMPTMTIVL